MSPGVLAPWLSEHHQVGLEFDPVEHPRSSLSREAEVKGFAQGKVSLCLAVAAGDDPLDHGPAQTSDPHQDELVIDAAALEDSCNQRRCLVRKSRKGCECIRPTPLLEAPHHVAFAETTGVSDGVHTSLSQS